LQVLAFMYSNVEERVSLWNDNAELRPYFEALDSRCIPDLGARIGTATNVFVQVMQRAKALRLELAKLSAQVASSSASF
jgi:hypothetical protein